MFYKKLLSSKSSLTFLPHKINFLDLIINLLPYIFVFISALYSPLDADLGWHLKYGEYFFKTGHLLNDNTFSTMMSDFKWPNTSWGVDLITYAAYHSLGFLGLTLLGAAVVTIIFFIFAKAFNLTLFEKSLIFPLLVIWESPVNSISFRGQILSILMLGLLVYALNRFDQGKRKMAFLTIPVFLLWVNLNGQFILGLVIFAIWTCLYLFRTLLPEDSIKNTRFRNLKENLSKNSLAIKIIILCFFLSIAASAGDPYGIEIHKTALSHFNNKDLQGIKEYLPIEDLTQPWWNQMIVGILLLFGTVFLFLTDKLKENIPNLGIISVFYTVSWGVRRYAWSLYYLTIPLLQPVTNFFKPDSEKNTKIAATVILLFSISLAVLFKYPFDKYSNYTWDDYCHSFMECSRGSIEYVINHNLGSQNLLSLYNWGGYIIWNYPQLKPSIDGRMVAWRDEKGYSAFEEYYPLEQNLKPINESRFDTVLTSTDKPMFDELINLVQEKKWRLVYIDKTSAVFLRNK